MSTIKNFVNNHNYIAALLFVILGFSLMIALTACGSKEPAAADPNASAASVEEPAEQTPPAVPEQRERPRPETPQQPERARPTTPPAARPAPGLRGR